MTVFVSQEIQLDRPCLGVTHAQGKGDGCKLCKGIGFIPTEQGEEIIRFIERYRGIITL